MIGPATLDLAEREALRASARDAFARFPPGCPPGSHSRGQLPRSDWRALLEGLGLAGALASDPGEGAGLTLADLLPLASEAGRALVDGPLVETAVLAPLALRRAVGNRDLAAGLERRLRDCEVIVGVGLNETGLHLRDGRLTGLSAPLPAAGDCDAFLLSVPSRQGHVLLELAADADELCLISTEDPDTIRPAARIRLDRAPAAVIGVLPQDAAEEIELCGAAWCVAELEGLAAQALDLTLEHVKTRRQFGQPLGVHQAVKHLCADMFAQVALLGGAVRRLADVEGAEARETTHIAKAFASGAAERVVESAIQLHGAMGFTWEYPLHHYLRRAWALRRRFGTPDAHRRRLLSILAGDRAKALPYRNNPPAE